MRDKEGGIDNFSSWMSSQILAQNYQAVKCLEFAFRSFDSFHFTT